MLDVVSKPYYPGFSIATVLPKMFMIQTTKITAGMAPNPNPQMQMVPCPQLGISMDFLKSRQPSLSRPAK
jgi:hypothetical protein